MPQRFTLLSFKALFPAQNFPAAGVPAAALKGARAEGAGAGAGAGAFSRGLKGRAGGLEAPSSTIQKILPKLAEKAGKESAGRRGGGGVGGAGAGEVGGAAATAARGAALPAHVSGHAGAAVVGAGAVAGAGGVPAAAAVAVAPLVAAAAAGAKVAEAAAEGAGVGAGAVVGAGVAQGPMAAAASPHPSSVRLNFTPGSVRPPARGFEDLLQSESEGVGSGASQGGGWQGGWEVEGGMVPMPPPRAPQGSSMAHAAQNAGMLLAQEMEEEEEEEEEAAANAEMLAEAEAEVEVEEGGGVWLPAPSQRGFVVAEQRAAPVQRWPLLLADNSDDQQEQSFINILR